MDSSERPKLPVVVVTGAASGVGAATVELLAGEYEVWAIDADARVLNRFIDSTWIHPVKADISGESEVRELIDHIVSSAGRLDGVVANAGICVTALAERTTSEMWDRVMAVDLRGVFLLAREALPALRDSPRGSFVAVSSELGLNPAPRLSAYSTAKAGVIHLMKALALENAALGVRFNAVAPGPTLTPMLSAHVAALGSDLSSAIAEVPLGRLGRPEEIASAIRFLLGSEASFVTGTVLVADGGATAG